VDRVCEEVVEEVVAEIAEVCPWMGEEEVGMVQEVFASQFRLVVGEEVDLGRMAGLLLGLAERAEVVGDMRRAWIFDQWYGWACAVMRGEAYHWPALPQELGGVP
jgi:hypothetical protein